MNVNSLNHVSSFKRLDGWENRLAAEIVRSSTLPFVFGSHDCCMFVANCIQAMVQQDVVSEWRRYKSKSRATYLLNKHGGVIGIASKIAKDLDYHEIRPSFASPGDVCIAEYKETQFMGLVDLTGRNILVAHDPGVYSYPHSYGVKAWRVG